MFCDGCGQNLLEKDFLPNQKQCFRCVYKKKLHIAGMKNKKCKECGSSVFAASRITYCSKECAEIGSKKARHESWVVKYHGAPGYF